MSKNNLLDASIGVMGGATAVVLPFMETLTVIAQAVGAVAGAIVACIALYRMVRSNGKPKK